MAGVRYSKHKVDTPPPSYGIETTDDLVMVVGNRLYPENQNIYKLY